MVNKPTKSVIQIFMQIVLFKIIIQIISSKNSFKYWLSKMADENNGARVLLELDFVLRQFQEYKLISNSNIISLNPFVLF